MDNRRDNQENEQVIKEVTTFIKDRTTGLTIDTNLFAGHRPQGVIDACDVVLESAGGSVFPELPERADIAFQVLSRAKTYFTARDRAWAIYNAIYRDWTYGSAGWTLPLILSDSISICDATGDWTGTALSIDGADYKEGAGSLKDNVVAPAVIANWYPTIYTKPAGSWDWSAKKHIFFWLKCDRTNTAFTYARLYVESSAGNYRWWNLTFAEEAWTAQKKLLSTPDGEVGTLDLTVVNKIHITFQAADIIAFYKKVDYIRVGIEEYEAMVIEPLASPQYIGQDEKGRWEFSCNYIFKTKRL